MAIKLEEPESEFVTASSLRPGDFNVETHDHTARIAIGQAIPNIDPEEYRLLYLPTMVGVYTARHQLMPASDEFLREHIFGAQDQPGCEACREETEFLVAHQKKFF